ncbi:MAG TPA: helix-hairpin-helix domain-containing protein [Desulfomonilia bacterium]|nr:helix-hairpin-helix domain-containing protein [Desulfomonilia bacterium]
MKNLKYIVAMAVLFLGVGLVGLNANAVAISDGSSGALNINTATVEELKMLPYVDGRTAEAIVSFRDAHGPFSSINELENVKGVSRPLLIDLHSHLILKGESTFNPYGSL